MGLIENQHRGRQRLAFRPSSWSKASDRRNDETRCECAECRITVKPPRAQQRIYDFANTVRQVRYRHDDGSTKAHGTLARCKTVSGQFGGYLRTSFVSSTPH